jgi:hypothetical protein
MLIYTNTRSKTKPKLKPKAEREAYNAWCQKHGITGKRTKTKPGIVQSPVVVNKPFIRENTKINSLGSFITGPVTVNNTKKVYTGDKMLGIAAMHKSNLVPVFTDESAVDISHMRR